MVGVGDEAGSASKRQRTSGPTEVPSQTTKMDSDSAVVEFKVNYKQAMQVATGNTVQSDSFSAGGYLWRINFDPYGLRISDKKFQYLFINLVPLSKSRSVEVSFDVLLMVKDYKQPVLFQRVMKTYSRQLLMSSPSTPKNLVDKFVNDGHMNFVCTIRVLSDNPIRVPPSDIAKHLGTLLDTADGTDVAFTIDGETFHAHRAVLAARSPVFRVELLGSMAEATMPHINLHDIAPATFKVMLQFMYTDSLPGDDELGEAPTEMLEDLLAAADRYALDRLKLLCAKKLWDNMSVDTVATTLACAEMYSCAELKQRCIGFFAEEENFKEAVLTDGFVKLGQMFPSIIIELRHNVLKK